MIKYIILLITAIISGFVLDDLTVAVTLVPISIMLMICEVRDGKRRRKKKLH